VKTSDTFPFVDRNMDMVMVRCYSSAASQTYMHVHTVQHVEEIYDANSLLNRFMSRPPVNAYGFKNVLDSMKLDIKPSIIRNPTTGVSVYGGGGGAGYGNRTPRTPGSARKKTPKKTTSITPAKLKTVTKTLYKTPMKAKTPRK
jgi:hypothetical protein